LEQSRWYFSLVLRLLFNIIPVFALDQVIVVFVNNNPTFLRSAPPHPHDLIIIILIIDENLLLLRYNQFTVNVNLVSNSAQLFSSAGIVPTRLDSTQAMAHLKAISCQLPVEYAGRAVRWMGIHQRGAQERENTKRTFREMTAPAATALLQ